MSHIAPVTTAAPRIASPVPPLDAVLIAGTQRMSRRAAPSLLPRGRVVAPHRQLDERMTGWGGSN